MVSWRATACVPTHRRRGRTRGISVLRRTRTPRSEALTRNVSYSLAISASLGLESSTAAGPELCSRSSSGLTLTLALILTYHISAMPIQESSFHDTLSPACSLRRCEQTSLPMRAAARSLQLMSALACAEKAHQAASLSLSGFGFGFGLNARIFAVRRTWVRALAKHRRHSKVLRAARTKPHSYARTYAPAPAHPHTRCTRAISTQRRWHPHPRRPITFDLHPHVILAVLQRTNAGCVVRVRAEKGPLASRFQA